MSTSSEILTGTVERAASPGGDLLTFVQWKARGRHVIRGERGVKVPAWRAADGSPVNVESTGKHVRTMAVVFRLDQTAPNENSATAWDYNKARSAIQWAPSSK